MKLLQKHLVGKLKHETDWNNIKGEKYLGKNEIQKAR